jgi:carbon-monoxide dehydrogenase large subunit
MECAIPKADDLPSFENDHTRTLSPKTALGVKGIGESATIGSTPAVANAVLDALAPFGVTHIDLPLTPEKIWKAMTSHASARASTRRASKTKKKARAQQPTGKKKPGARASARVPKRRG